MSDLLDREVGKTYEDPWFGDGPSSNNIAPTRASLQDALSIFETGLVIHKGDPEAAGQYTKDLIRNSASTVTISSNGEEKAHVIMGAGRVEKQLNTPLSDLINYGESSDYFMFAVESLLGDTSVLDKKNQQPLTKLSDVENLQITTIPGYDGIILNSPSAPNPFPITLEQLQDLEARNTRHANEIALKAENKKTVERRRIERSAGYIATRQ